MKQPFQPKALIIYKKEKLKGYTVTLLFFWLQSLALVKDRVQTSVKEGGHNIEPKVIERRYASGIKNLFETYLPIVHGINNFDNSNGIYELIATKKVDGKLEVIDPKKKSTKKRDMTTDEEQLALRDIVKGLELAYERLIEHKKLKKSKLVVMRNGKIVWLDSEDA